ncbi:GGDEF domain-containing protein [Marinobacter shengliensis]|uniref:sensor domain-containing diguanylate cyclase n=1 Tax=Marinobacter shengliensis TaxID=1389223 RepID=UPI002E7B5F0E|nr:diguanylate cyclase [Marinobacter shengliensis]
MIKLWFASLANRAVALVVAFVLVTAVVVASIGSALSRSELEYQAHRQVEMIVGMVTRDLDQKLALRRDVLSHVASEIPASEALLQNRARVILRQQASLLSLFDALFIMDAEGELLAANPLDYLVPSFNASERPYFKAVSSQLVPIISEPYVTALEGRPGVMLAAPLFDHRKRFTGMIGGLILLDGDNFMSDISGIRVGDAGYLRLITRQGVVLADGRDGRVMVPVDARQSSIVRAMEGFEGTLRDESEQQMPTITAYGQMAQVPWFVAAVWPETDAFASVNRMRDAFSWTLLSVLVVLVPLAFWFFHRLLRPLRDLSLQIYQRHTGERQMPVSEIGGREIRNVARVFNMVRHERDEILRSLAEREAFFRSLTQDAPIGIVHSNILGRIEFVNPALLNILGETAEQVTQRYLISKVADEDRDAAMAGWRRALTRRRFYRGRLRLLTTRSPGYVWVDTMTSVIELPDQALGTITIVRDITREMRFEQALREEQQRADSILDVLQEGVLMVDKAGLIRYANDAAGEFLALGDDCIGENFFETVTFRYDNHKMEPEEFQEGEEIDNRYVTLENSQGQVFDIDLTMLHLRRGEHEERLVFVLRDDSERRREEERLSWEATHDALTQLVNRRAFTAALLKALAEAPHQATPAILMMIDLDHFKPVNDQGGHLVGDDLLKRLADLFQSAVRQSDTVARLGGDEFAVLLPGCGLDRAEALAENLRSRVEALKVQHDGRSFGVTVSIGLTPVSVGDNGPREVMARADEGCYIAKSRGRNAVVSVPAPPDDTRV